MFNWLRKKVCSHEFVISDIKMTGIPVIEMPTNGTYKDWAKYHSEYYDCDGVTKRISCECRKCKQVFYAHCGLDLKGKLI
jgi:hypothetical protein